MRSREGQVRLDRDREKGAYCDRGPATQFRSATGGRLPLKGYLHLYQAHLRSERQALKTIEVYSSGLHKFEAWFRATYEAEPALADFSGDQVRFFNNNMAVSG